MLTECLNVSESGQTSAEVPQGSCRSVTDVMQLQFAAAELGLCCHRVADSGYCGCTTARQEDLMTVVLVVRSKNTGFYHSTILSIQK